MDMKLLIRWGLATALFALGLLVFLAWGQRSSRVSFEASVVAHLQGEGVALVPDEVKCYPSQWLLTRLSKGGERTPVGVARLMVGYDEVERGQFAASEADTYIYRIGWWGRLFPERVRVEFSNRVAPKRLVQVRTSRYGRERQLSTDWLDSDFWDAVDADPTKGQNWDVGSNP